MLGLGLGEILVMAAIALVVVGPERLPKLMRELGRWYGQLRRAADDLRRSFVLEADRQDAAERYKKLQERRKEAQEARRLAQEAAGEGTATQPDEAAVAEAPVDPALEGDLALHSEGAQTASDPVQVPNDIPPDAPHPEAMARADAERRATGRRPMPDDDGDAASVDAIGDDEGGHPGAAANAQRAEGSG